MDKIEELGNSSRHALTSDQNNETTSFIDSTAQKMDKGWLCAVRGL